MYLDLFTEFAAEAGTSISRKSKRATNNKGSGIIANLVVALVLLL